MFDWHLPSHDSSTLTVRGAHAEKFEMWTRETWQVTSGCGCMADR